MQGEMPGYGGELQTAQFMLTRSVVPGNGEMKVGSAGSARIATLGLLIDLRDEEGVALTKIIMEDPTTTKLIWGADGDLTSLRHQHGLGSIRSESVVDVQLGYSDPTRRLGMGRMLTRVPYASVKGLPAKEGHADYSPQAQNRRCMSFPMSADFACYVSSAILHQHVLAHIHYNIAFRSQHIPPLPAAYTY